MSKNWNKNKLEYFQAFFKALWYLCFCFLCMTCANKELRRMHHWKNGKKCHWCILLHGCWRNYIEFPRIANIIIVTCVKLSADVIYSSVLLHIQRIYQLKNWTRNREKIPQSERAFPSICSFIIRKVSEFPFSILSSSKLWLFSREEVIRSYFTNLVENHYKNRIKG